jgi:6-pyruvoyltetrahydropterin/6-carboxytetrahydropterin synthase
MERGRSVTIKGDEFKFCCAHFVAHKGYRERLHGHNYTVEVDLTGPMSPDDGYVIDFGIVKRSMRSICKSLNERIIVPMESECLSITVHDAVKTDDEKYVACDQSSVEDQNGTEQDGQVELRFGNTAFFSFPKSDCALLPLKFSTAENISAYFATILEEELRQDICKRGIDSLTVRVFERPTQAASYTMTLPI